MFTSFSGIANTFLIISADLSSSKYKKRAITLVESGENMNFFLVIVTCMILNFNTSATLIGKSNVSKGVINVFTDINDDYG